MFSRRRDEKHFVAGLDHRMAFGHDRRVLAEDRRDARLDVGHVAADIHQFMADHRAAMKRAHRDETHLAAREFEHLQRFRKLDQLDNVIGDDLLGADRMIDREAVAREDLRMRQIVGRADARDAGGRIEEFRGELARHEIRFVAARDRENEVGVGCARLGQHQRVRGVAGDGAQIEPVLQHFQPRRLGVDDGDVIGFRTQGLGDGAADLSRAEYDDFQSRLNQLRLKNARF